MADFFSIISNTIKEILGQSAGKPLENNGLEVKLENANKRLQSINENIYPQYVQNPQAFLEKPGALWFVRKDLETARFYMSGGTEGYGDSSQISGNGFAMTDPHFWELKAFLSATEMKVREIETAKGYRFAGVQNNTILFINLRTNQLLSSEESGEI